MNKKGIEITFSNLIYALLAIVILAVLILVFTGNINLFTKNNECRARGGDCTIECEYMTLPLKGCDENEVCCIKPS